MTRVEFLKICGLFGIGLPLQSGFMSCREEQIPASFTGKVLVIGAGAGGLSAGYFLHQKGIDFDILEASDIYGGRMKITKDFADFPIPLGAEWLETNPKIFQEIVNDPSVNVQIQTFPDTPDKKFVNYSWFQFFEDYITPSVSTKIRFRSVVQSIEYGRKQIEVKTNNRTYLADKVIISVPLQVLKNRGITFIPELPQPKLEAIEQAVVWDGFKAFFEFKTNFYGEDEYIFSINPETDGQKIYYNASLGQRTNKHILSLFVVGIPAQIYISRTGNDLKDFVLRELDQIYSNQATPNYLRHITQNWNKEPYIQGGYLSDYADPSTVKELGQTVNNSLFFVGGEYTDGKDWVSVHTAAASAKRAVDALTS